MYWLGCFVSSLPKRNLELKGNVLPRLVRCRVCPRCGSGSFRKVRADAVIALRKVRECRKCSQQYRPPMPAWLSLLLMLAGTGMMVWLGLRVKDVGISRQLFDEVAPLILAGLGGMVVLFGLVKLLFDRGINPPPRQDWRERTEPTPPAVPKGVNFASIAPTPAVITPPASPVSPAPPIVAPPGVAAPARTGGPTPASSVAVSSAGDGPMPSPLVLESLQAGAVIPAHPLALNSHREFDVRRMRTLSRYYLAAGAHGLAVGVHTTQFGIRKPKHNLLRPVLETVSQVMRSHETRTAKPLIKVAGICGNTSQAVAEAELARELGYDIGLLNLGAVPVEATDYELIQHCRSVANVIPLFGFYLNPAIGGRPLPFKFWRAFAEIGNVVAIKIAAFNRYQTLEVMRAVAEAGRSLTAGTPGTPGNANANAIAIYTGNDDTIISDLVGDWRFDVNGVPVSQRIVGGLLGHWACWTRAAVDTFGSLKQIGRNGSIPADTALLARQVTDMNGAIFDAANNFRGAIPGVLDVLHRQGLIDNNLCLDPNESLSPGQAEEITRVIHAYPHLTDDAFVQEHLNEWIQ